VSSATDKPSGNSSQRTDRGLFRRFFLSAAPDVVGLLLAQGKLSLLAMETFARWSTTGDHAEIESLRAIDERADDARRALLAALRSALSSPIDQEDLYILSERCDRVVNAAKNLSAEAEALAWNPDTHAAGMASHLCTAMSRLVDGFSNLTAKPDQAGESADEAIEETRAVVQGYRVALAEALGSADLQAVFTRRELYRSYARIADLTAAVADRLWYAVLAQA
jgi:uncharacterized protein Yka (UPF0111/DUF47 family)